MNIREKLENMKEISARNDKISEEFESGNSGNFYFTFGSDPEFPYGRDDYVQISAPSIGDAIKLFRALHPNRPNSNCLNCAFVYNEAQWEQTKRYYVGVDPIETITVRRRGD